MTTVWLWKLFKRSDVDENIRRKCFKIRHDENAREKHCWCHACVVRNSTKYVCDLSVNERKSFCCSCNGTCYDDSCVYRV